jgi:hypothetical protein
VNEVTADLINHIEEKEQENEPQIQTDSSNVVELVLVGDEGNANYEFTTSDGQTTFQLPPGMVIQHLIPRK